MTAVTTRSGFIPALEGMRGLSSLAVLVTHVAFQTGSAQSPVLGRVLGRFDLAVAVFFALSGFLLWRPHAEAARGLRSAPPVKEYLLSRVTRILPAYWLVVVVVLLLLPQAGGGWRVWFANLTLTQVFLPLTLTQGMTQMWSLSVEVAFYLLLPIAAFALMRLRGTHARFRIPTLLVVSALGLGWAFLPIRTAEATNIQNWVPGYLPWFAAGMVLAEVSIELRRRPATRIERWSSQRRPMLVLAGAAFALSATDLAGPEGLVTPAPWQYSIKIALGFVFSYALLAPLILVGDQTPQRYRYLTSTVGMMLGRWSYGIFIWHLAILAVVFPIFGILPFGGHFWFVLVVTTVLSILVASASYAFVEAPVGRALLRREGRQARNPEAEISSAATPTAATESSAKN